MTFADFARGHGLLIRDLRADGRIHRVPTATHPRSRNGAYKFTGEWGWLQDWSEHDAPVLFRADGVAADVIRRDLAKLHAQEAQARARASREAVEVIARCQYNRHPYLERKGFPDEQVLVGVDGRMVVPMRDCADYKRVNSVQWIAPDGEKKFMPGGAAGGSVFFLGSGTESWLCEGYATALSVRAALQAMYRRARVVVCFSAGNLARVARLLTGPRYVAADHDASGTGERYARETGLPWVMPPELGDFNDMHQAHGARAVGKRLMEVV